MMRALRRDPLSGAWVALCPGRVEVVRPEAPAPRATCPACASADGARLGERGRAWARPQPVPALIVEAVDAGEGLGAHEQVVADAAHRGLRELGAEELADWLLLARDRHRDLLGDHRLRWLGWSSDIPAAGGHAAASVVALPFVPPEIGALEARVRADPHLLLQTAARAGAEGRGVLSLGACEAWVPAAPAVPFEVVVASREAGAQWAASDDATLREVARGVHAVVKALGEALGPAALRLHLVQGGREAPEAPLWHLRLRPATAVAVESLGGVVPVHPGLPAPAAERLRPLCHDALREEDGRLP